MRFLSFLVFVFITIVSHSVCADGYYKWKDAHGNIQYGDSPPKHVKLEKLQLPELTIIEDYGSQWESPTEQSDKQIKQAVTSKLVVKRVEESYDRFSFIAPKLNQVIRAKDGDVSAMLSIKPPLKIMHKIVYKLDGKIRDNSSSRIANFKNLTFGYHVLSANIVNVAGETIQSTDEVKFRVIRFNKSGKVAKSKKRKR